MQEINPPSEKLKKAKYRVGPELELTGYGCEDAFLENDTVTHVGTSSRVDD